MRRFVVLVAVLGCAGDPPQLPSADTTAATTTDTSTTTADTDGSADDAITSTSTSGGTASSVTDPDPDSTSAGSDATGEPPMPQSCLAGPTACDSPPGTVPDGRCNAFLQDCDAGQVCVPLGGPGGSTTCTPALGSVGEGDSCQTKAPGLDNCAEGLICVQLDDTGHRCYPFCGCGPAYPTCPDGSLCSLAASGTWGACGPPCDPLADTCDFVSVLGNLSCFPAPQSAGFVCTQTTNANAAPGTECESHSDCGDGQACLSSLSAPSCTGLGGSCCVDLCDLADPATCEAGSECTPWYVIPGLGCNVNVGYCGFPQ